MDRAARGNSWRGGYSIALGRASGIIANAGPGRPALLFALASLTPMLEPLAHGLDGPRSAAGTPPRPALLSVRPRPWRWAAQAVLGAALCTVKLSGFAHEATPSSANPNPPFQSAPAAEPSSASRLPALGDTASEELSLGAERKLGDAYMAAIRRDSAYLDDPVLQAYIDAMWQRLKQAATELGYVDEDLVQHFALDAFLLRDRSVNAFAMPGGYMGVHAGLIAACSAPDELASVLAHELTHITQRHIARGMANSGRQSLVGMAAMLAGLLVAGKTGDFQVAQAAITTGQALAIQGQLNFSRDMEREADRIAHSIMQKAGYDPAGMPSMFELLERASRFYDTTSYPYLRTHPLTDERIGDARARVGPLVQGPTTAGVEAMLIQARSRVLMDARAESLDRLASRAAHLRPGASLTATERLVALYEAALALSLLREHTKAHQHLQDIDRVLADLPSVEPSAKALLAMLRAEVAAAAGTIEKAHHALSEAPAVTLWARPLLLQRARLAALPQASAEWRRLSLDALQTWTAQTPKDAQAWEALVPLWRQEGKPLRAARAEAESRYALGDLRGAIERLRGAQHLERQSPSHDRIEAAVIDARARALEAERRERSRDLRRRSRQPGPDDEP
jgi:predicted Zn-dependent protease